MIGDIQCSCHMIGDIRCSCHMIGDIHFALIWQSFDFSIFFCFVSNHHPIIMPRRGTDSHNMRHGKRSKNMHQMIPHMMPSMMSHPGGMMFPHMMPSMLPPGPESDSESEANEVPASNPASHAASTSAAPSNGSNVAAAVEPPPPPSHGPELSDAMRQKISRSLTYVRQLPRWFLQEVVEYLNSNFDSTLVADLTQHGLLALLFLFCRIKPNVRISELRSFIEVMGQGSGLFGSM